MEELAKINFQLVFPEAFKATRQQVQEFSSSALEFFHQLYEYDGLSEELYATADIYNQYEVWYAKENKPERFKLQAKQFFSVLNKNFPGIVTPKTAWSQVQKKSCQAKAHLRLIHT